MSAADLRRMFTASLGATLLVACGDSIVPDELDAAPAVDAPPVSDASSLDGGRPVLPEAPPGTPPSGPPSVTVLTFNMGLIQLVRGPAERKPVIVDELRASGADVICLQESFNQYTSPGDMAARIADVYPYAWWSPAGETNWGNGLVIASKYPLYRGRERRYQAQDPGRYVDRMVLSAHVLTPTSYFAVMCTHLQAGLQPEYRGIKRAELDEAIAFAGEQGYLDGPLFFLGDFNFGPDPTGQCVDGAEPPCQGACTQESQPCTLPPDVENYDRALQTFGDPFAGRTECSSCRDQFIPMAVLPLYTNEPDQRIDHVFTRNIGASRMLSGERIFDGDDGYQIQLSNGETIYWLSDHYGMKGTFGP